MTRYVILFLSLLGALGLCFAGGGFCDFGRLWLLSAVGL